MTEQEYRIALIAIDKEKELKIKALKSEFTLSNNTISVGDVIEDYIGFGLVEKISWSHAYGYQLPECSYYCKSLRRDLKPFKNGESRWIFQSNLIKK